MTPRDLKEYVRAPGLTETPAETNFGTQTPDHERGTVADRDARRDNTQSPAFDPRRPVAFSKSMGSSPCSGAFCDGDH